MSDLTLLIAGAILSVSTVVFFALWRLATKRVPYEPLANVLLEVEEDLRGYFKDNEQELTNALNRALERGLGYVGIGEEE